MCLQICTRRTSTTLTSKFKDLFEMLFSFLLISLIWNPVGKLNLTLGGVSQPLFWFFCHGSSPFWCHVGQKNLIWLQSSVLRYVILISSYLLTYKINQWLCTFSGIWWKQNPKDLEDFEWSSCFRSAIPNCHTCGEFISLLGTYQGE